MSEQGRPGDGEKVEQNIGKTPSLCHEGRMGNRVWHNGWVWNMPPIGWSGKLKYRELTRGTNACMWSAEAALHLSVFPA